MSTGYIIYLCITTPLAIYLGVYIIRKYVAALRSNPHIQKEDIVYQENFASGHSQKNFFTRIGGANNCLKLVVTRDLLWVTAWFPFGLFAAAYDLVHVIPLRRISSVKFERYFSMNTFLLTFTDDEGGEHTLRLAPKKPNEFLQAIGQPVADMPSLPKLPSDESLLGYFRHYRSRLLPGWLFPFYAFGIAFGVEHLGVPNNIKPILALVLIAPAFFYVNIRAQVSEIPYGKRFLLTMVAPFFLFIVATLVFGTLAEFLRAHPL